MGAEDFAPNTGYQKQPQANATYEPYPQAQYTQPHEVVVVQGDPTEGTNITPGRAHFLVRVFAVLGAQLLVAVGFCSLFYFIDPVRDWMIRYSWWTLLVAFIAEIVTLIVLFIVRKKPGLNAVALVAFTFTTSYVLSTVLCLYDVVEIFEGVAITAVIVVGCIAYVLIAGPNFRLFFLIMISGFLLLLSWSLWFLISGLWLRYDNWVWYYQIYCLIAVVAFTGVFLFRVSVIITLFPEDEYIMAAVDLYLHILIIFMYVLGAGKR